MTFEVRKGDTTVRSVWTNSVRNAFRKQAGWAKLQEARAAAAIGHIQSAGCLGQKEVVTAAHNACIRELLQEVDAHGKADRHMKLLTVETESSLGTLWDQEQCTQFCSKFPCGQQLVKYGYKEKAECIYCARRHMRRMEAAGKECCQRKLSAISKVPDA